MRLAITAFAAVLIVGISFLGGYYYRGMAKPQTLTQYYAQGDDFRNGINARMRDGWQVRDIAGMGEGNVKVELYR